jgi:mono/diheme cytochrome c family protein
MWCIKGARTQQRPVSTSVDQLNPIRLLLVIVIGLAMSGGFALVMAQDAKPTTTPAPVELSCALDELQAQQAALAAALATFEQDAAENPGAALDALFKTGAAYQELALTCGYIPADAATRAVGTDVERILRALDTVSGDPLNGQLLYNGALACASCHEVGGGTVAPHTEGTYTRAEETRLADPMLAEYSIEQYLVESIVLPASYVVPNYTNVMPTLFGETLTLQELADLVTFLESQDGPSPE